MDTLYVSQSNIYLSSSRYNLDVLRTSIGTNSIYNTDVHQIAMDGDRLRFVGTGSVEGLAGWGEKASFRFGEHNGSLGVVTSLNNGWWGSNSNRVTILQPSTVAPGMLRTVSFLPNAARPQPLG